MNFFSVLYRISIAFLFMIYGFTVQAQCNGEDHKCVDFTLISGAYVPVIANESVLIEPGAWIQKGSDFLAIIAPDPLHRYQDKQFNWTHDVEYDNYGNEIASARTYFDDLGKSNLSISKDYINNKYWGTEVSYDDFGRVDETSFPALLADNSFEKLGLLTTSPEEIYYVNFNYTINRGTAEYIENPQFYETTEDLFNYYSNNNTLEPYQATATHPFLKNIYDDLNPGNIRQVIGGNQIDENGQMVWKTGFSYTMPAAQEMHYVYGHEYFDSSDEDEEYEVIQTKFFKTVSIDSHGIESVSFTDGEGKVLATARSGGSNSYSVISIIGEQGYIDVHIPIGITNSEIEFLGNLSNYTIYDLWTGQEVLTSQMTGGSVYRVEYQENIKDVVILNKSDGELRSFYFGIKYPVNYYDYSVNIYNKSGQLVRVVQPNGYEENTAIVAKPSHMQYELNEDGEEILPKYVSSYKYNNLGQLKETTSPDEGTARFKYRLDGQIRYSQNSEQAKPAALADKKVSYTEYDALARPIESGVMRNVDFEALDPDGDKPASAVLSEQTFTIYDYVGNDEDVESSGQTLAQVLSWSNVANASSYVQKNLSGNVVTSYNDQSQTWYSYDIYGRLEWSVQYIPTLGANTVHYKYDGRGNVKEVIYQKDSSKGDYFAHSYSYNTNGALTSVSTRDGSEATWEKQADYIYYVDGKLKRVILAEGLQGIDYVYTLSGALKSINHPSLLADDDPGRDDDDVFGMTIDYYSGDYLRGGKASAIKTTSSGDDRYDGNIKATRWANRAEDGSVTAGESAAIKSAIYTYNKNKWLKSAHFGDYSPTDNTASKLTKLYEGNLNYDANGNIQTLARRDHTGLLSDDLRYTYSTTNNRLLNVTDQGEGTTDEEIKGSNDYQYNSIGQLTENVGEHTKYFYNTQGLVTEVHYQNVKKVAFRYDERGQRVRKDSYANDGTTVIKSDFYVRDLSGNIMSIYTQSSLNGNEIKQNEIPIYGGSRLGVFFKNGTTQYQITDHLGNVRSVVERQNNLPYQTDYADYYPFGERMTERTKLGNYRFTYQGQEHDDETGNEAFQLRLWDGRIGRWLTTDPYGQYHSAYLGMGNNPTSRIDSDGGIDSPIFDENGEYLGVDSEGYKGKIIIMPKEKYETLKGDSEVVDHEEAKKHDQGMNSVKSYEAMSKIQTHILTETGFDTSKLLNGETSIYADDRDYINGKGYVNLGYNNPSRPGRYRGEYLGEKGIRVTTNIIYFSELSSVELVVNYLGVHEFTGHGLNKWETLDDHYKAWELQKKHKTFHSLPKEFQEEIINNIKSYKQRAFYPR